MHFSILDLGIWVTTSFTVVLVVTLESRDIMHLYANARYARTHPRHGGRPHGAKLEKLKNCKVISLKTRKFKICDFAYLVCTQSWFCSLVRSRFEQVAKRCEARSGSPSLP